MKRGRPRSLDKAINRAWRAYVRADLRDLAKRFLKECPTASGMFRAGFEAGLEYAAKQGPEGEAS